MSADMRLTPFAEHVDQVGDDRDEHQCAEHTHAEGHGDVAGQDTAELVAIDAGAGHCAH
jgi:hypothetical protein